MKYRIYNFGGDGKFGALEDESLRSQFEIIQPREIGIEELLKEKYEAIKITDRQVDLFLPYINGVDWKINQIGMADFLIFRNNIYKAHNIFAKSLMRIIKKHGARINSQMPAIVIGNVHFVFSVIVNLAFNGFVEIIASIVDAGEEDVLHIENRIRSYIFDLNLKFVPIGDLTSIDENGALLISNFQKEKNVEAYELLTYFNFLSQGAVLIDCNSNADSSLIEDARRAEIFVIDEKEVVLNKYNYLLETMKNSP